MKPIALAAALLSVAPAVAQAAADPAADRVEAFNGALVEAMKGGHALGAQGRFRKLEPAVEQAFDLPLMARVAVGPTWTTLPQADQDRLVKLFGRFTTASWAKNFDDYSGEKFQIGQVSANAAGDKLVRNQMVQKSGDPVVLNYRMRNSNGAWKIVDVLYNGSVSSIATQRSDFAATLKSGGAPALEKRLESQTAELLRAK